MGDIKLFIPTMVYSPCEVLFRITAIQSLLTLLGSCVCSPSHRHVVSVHHGDGSVERHPSAAPVPDSTLLRWKLLLEAMKHCQVEVQKKYSTICHVGQNKQHIEQIVQSAAC